MTRETKIGLLVGLAFIIVIGILLSDHMTSTTEPLAAPLSNTANNVRESVGSPAGDPPPITIVTQTISPREPVNTHSDPNVSRPTQSIVQIGGPAAALDNTPIQIRQSSSHPAPAPVQTVVTDIPPSTRGSLQQVAQSNGEPIVGLGNLPDGSPAADNGARKYVAQAGDTLSRLAGRFMGGNTKFNRDAIVKANPSLQQDPNRMIVGRTYLIPAGNVAGPAAPAAAAPTPVPPATPSQAATAQPQYWYTVKENDSLWSIAADQLGNGSAWTAIKDLNADVLKGSDTVHPNMKLRLPAKPIASAQ